MFVTFSQQTFNILSLSSSPGPTSCLSSVNLPAASTLHLVFLAGRFPSAFMPGPKKDACFVDRCLHVSPSSAFGFITRRSTPPISELRSSRGEELHQERQAPGRRRETRHLGTAPSPEGSPTRPIPGGCVRTPH